MNTKRSTPQSKHPPAPSSGSRVRTSPWLNSTVLERGNTSVRPFRCGSATKPVRSHTNLDVTGIGNTTTVPNIRTKLLNNNISRNIELECDFVFSDYLQALFKQEIITNSIQRHTEDIHDQLIIQKDKSYKSKVCLQQLNQELEEIDVLEEVDQILNIVDKNLDQFLHLNDDFDLSNTLEQLLGLFSQFCNNLSVKNVKTFEKKEDFDRLQSILDKCVIACQRMNMVDRNVEEVNKLAEVVKKYEKKLDSVGQRQKSINTLQNNEMHRLLKSVSDMYSQREKYSNSCRT